MKREITKQRSKYVKHYDLGHGRRQAVLYPRAVHYRDQDEWKDIDNQLIASERGKRAVMNETKMTLLPSVSVNPAVRYVRLGDLS